MDDLLIVAAQVWNLAGKRPVGRKELAEVLYARLRWFPPSEAELVVQRLHESGLFVTGTEAGTWVGAPILEGVAVPLTYRPPERLGTMPAVAPPDLFERVLEETARRTKVPAAQLREEASRVEKELGVDPPTAALLVAWRREVDLPKLREEASRALRDGTR